MIDPTMVTTNIELSGYRIIKNLGIVRGITVRSRSILGNIAGGFQTLFGGNISIYQELCERTREDGSVIKTMDFSLCIMLTATATWNWPGIT